MSSTACYFYLVIKYVVIAHMLDVGYSKSRNKEYRRKNLALAYNVIVQVATTAWIIRHFSLTLFIDALIFEALLLTFCAFVDRRANIIYAIKIFLATEVAMLLGYVLIAYRLMH